MKKNQTKTAVNKNSKNFYAFGTYKPNKNAVPVTYNGKTYLSKAQCMALEGITRKELDAYLKGEPVPEVAQDNYDEWYGVKIRREDLLENESELTSNKWK